MVSEGDFEFVRELVRADAGIVLDEDKHYLVDSRLQRFSRDHGDLDALMAQLRDGDTHLRAAVVEAMAIQETYFFRDPWLFDALAGDIIPDLMEKRAAERTLRIWCAACATGQEIYSICMLLRESFPQLVSWRLEVLASDFSREALGRAESGLYSLPEVNRGLPVRMLTKYFAQQGLSWQLGSQVRNMVNFASINLVGEWPELPTFDVILLRNVLIYFDEATRRDVLSRVAAQLRQDGALFMGGTESPMGFSSCFVPGAERNCYYYRLGGT